MIVKKKKQGSRPECMSCKTWYRPVRTVLTVPGHLEPNDPTRFNLKLVQEKKFSPECLYLACWLLTQHWTGCLKLFQEFICTRITEPDHFDMALGFRFMAALYSFLDTVILNL